MKSASKTRQRNFRVSEEVSQIFETAARAAHMSLSTWLTAVGLQAAGHTELADQLRRVQPAKKLGAKNRGAR